MKWSLSNEFFLDDDDDFFFVHFEFIDKFVCVCVSVLEHFCNMNNIVVFFDTLDIVMVIKWPSSLS